MVHLEASCLPRGSLPPVSFFVELRHSTGAILHGLSTLVVLPVQFPLIHIHRLVVSGGRRPSTWGFLWRRGEFTWCRLDWGEILTFWVFSTCIIGRSTPAVPSPDSVILLLSPPCPPDPSTSPRSPRSPPSRCSTARASLQPGCSFDRSRYWSIFDTVSVILIINCRYLLLDYLLHGHLDLRSDRSRSLDQQTPRRFGASSFA